jgi:hypothetical protein
LTLFFSMGLILFVFFKRWLFCWWRLYSVTCSVTIGQFLLSTACLLRVKSNFRMRVDSGDLPNSRPHTSPLLALDCHSMSLGSSLLAFLHTSS